MAIKVDVLCKKDEMKRAETVVKSIQRAADMSNLKVVINLSCDFRAFAPYSYNPSQTPAVFIHGQFELSGWHMNLPLIQKKLVELRDRGGVTF